MESDYLKLRSVVMPQMGSEGFFHCWCKEPFFNDDTGGYITKTYALIELTNGIIKFIEPPLIKFRQPYRPHGGVNSTQ